MANYEDNAVCCECSDVRQQMRTLQKRCDELRDSRDLHVSKLDLAKVEITNLTNAAIIARKIRVGECELLGMYADDNKRLQAVVDAADGIWNCCVRLEDGNYRVSKRIMLKLRDALQNGGAK
jgi:hypothetical protein